MPAIDVIVPPIAPRGWQKLLIERLQAEGHDVAVLHQPEAARWPLTTTSILALERRLFRRKAFSLAAPTPQIPQALRPRRPSLRLDLTGSAAPTETPTISFTFNGHDLDTSVATTAAAGTMPVVEARLDRTTVIGRARPMIDRRESTALAAEDIFARAVTLAVSVVHSFFDGRIGTQAQLGEGFDGGDASPFLRSYLTQALPRLTREAIRRLSYRHAHWHVGYRFDAVASVAEDGKLGTGWSVLPSPADHFYADPFAFQWQGQDFLFVEDYPHATGKAVISVVPFDSRQTPQQPQIVLEEPHHLSYPQVFERDGVIWMLPEASASGRLTLYRAVEFPYRWTPDTILLEGEISDATLLDHNGLLWLFATLRDGYGSTSDTLAVFYASQLRGPWKQHALNPIVIDHRMARPGGAFVRTRSGRLVLPLQDGSLGYGGGLGLAELVHLDREKMRLSSPQPIATEGDWLYLQIHTLNRSGQLEVIDGIGAMRKSSRTK
ncbi:hypothetical protein [Methylocella sp. CPCC 101449]|uniref:glucosamine inositolphosphorylceramide transferase family protein n=1 Tax=Methylocella sp. CPCC 101449 TaxID=2987531 RepID=UPI00288DA4B4|nr:hypothetical protein [Methylocella sp. CPCC 101449]MDT2022949.1 hypothetical protein [Methylocella sp. CPCC 101449]